MSIRGRDFLKVAKLCQEEGSEVACRSSASRSYYALYHEVCSALVHCPPYNHEGVIRYLTEGSQRHREPYELTDLMSLGAVLRQLKKKRVFADYNLGETFDKNDAESTIKSATKTIDKIDSMKS
ncbi:hypothetical protein R84981_002814 [Carnimonas sp. R-84981]|uniref:HEPN domain-containing protein n=1 Tax=Carnimonas bestiolae TaxID=3402172 RepID=UPI003EDC9E56